MTESKTIEVQAEVVRTPDTQAVAVRPAGGAVGAAMSIDQLRERLAFVRRVMAEELKEKVDYGKIPGCGDKPTLLQPGAQKLLLTFGLREQVTKETMREFPQLAIPLHREYEITVSVFPSGSSADQGWHGVGTCSTLEAKYRYRKAERRCPQCGKKTIIAGKAEFGGGFLCWAKKGGCGAKFANDAQAILSQPAGQEENENPADCWNTVRKMAFKRALVAAAINATNTSELWTQDIEDMGSAAADDEPERPPRAAGPPSRPPTAPPRQNAPAAPAPEAAAPRYATDATRKWMLQQLNAGVGMQDHGIVHEYFCKSGIILDTESLDDVPLRFVPIDKEQLGMLRSAIRAFGNGEQAGYPFKANPEAPAPKPEKKSPKSEGKPSATSSPPLTGQSQTTSQTPTKTTSSPDHGETSKAIEVPRDGVDPNSPDAPWRSFPMPFGKCAGQKLEDLDKKYLFGLWANFQPSATWEDGIGQTRKTDPDKLAKDFVFRAMLDEAGKHYEFHKKEEK